VLNWLYTAISWILLRWHDVWSFLGEREILGTNWDWVLAIIFLVITVRVILFPLFVKQIKSQRAMQALQPQMKVLKEKHEGDRETLQKEMMELYRKEKANPLMGCLPLVLQIPVFISLFWILRRLDPNQTINTDLYTWTHDQFHSASLAQLFGAPIASRFFDDEFDKFAELSTSITNVRIVTGVLVVVMMITTYLTAKQMIVKTGWATDPTQLMMQRMMVYGLPFLLLFSGAFFPLGVVIYWVVQNLFSLAQQQWVLRKYPPPATVTDAAEAPPGGGPKSAGAKLAGGKSGAGAKDGKAGKSGKGGKGGAPEEPPPIDGKKLAPKPGAKPVHAKKVPAKRVPPSKNIPPKRKSSAPRKG
jgi:YidC/Oxa1 family membrane protein insertase